MARSAQAVLGPGSSAIHRGSGKRPSKKSMVQGQCVDEHGMSLLCGRLAGQGRSGRAGGWPLAAGVAYGGDQEIEVVVVEAGECLVEVDGDSFGEGCGDSEYRGLAA